MFGWSKKRQYRDQVMANVLALTVMLDSGAVDAIESMLPGLRDHINDQYKEGADPYLLSVNIAAVVLTEAIAGMDPAARQRCADQITQLVNGEEELAYEQEPFVARYLIMHKVAVSWEREGWIELADRDRLEHEVYGALLGLDREERSQHRIESALASLVAG